MPGDVFALFALAIVAGTLITIVKTVVAYLGSRRHEKAPTPDSLTTSELMGMIQTAVAEANAPLIERIEALEETPRSLSEASPLLEVDGPVEALSREAPSRQRVR